LIVCFFRVVVLESIRSEYEHVLKLNISLEKDLEEYTNELITIKSVTNSLINHLKEQTERISLEKVNLFIYIKSKKIIFIRQERLNEENTEFRDRLQNLKIDFENSESVQHDFVKLSQALQVF